MRSAAAASGRLPLAMLATALVALALLRPVDHDESQYVAAAVLTAAGRLPYVDFAYLQTPLQPFVFAPVAALAGPWTWPALRIVNALLGAVAVAGVRHGAQAAGADARQALAVAALFACCDVLLFSVGVARNDALPVACFAWAVALVADGRRGTWRAWATGCLLALAAAAKISYAVPAGVYGVYALLHSDRRPLLVAAGALPVVAFVAWTASLSLDGFTFGTLVFPTEAPARYYADQPWRLSMVAKALDAVKFLALGAALPALAVVGRDAVRRRPDGLDLLLLAALAAALLPSPTWRQYLLPVLPPLFVRLARCWASRPPSERQRRLLGLFSAGGIAAAAAATTAPGELHLLPALRQAQAAGRVMDSLGVVGPVVTLSPQLLPATRRLPDERFAAGPFYFRSDGLLAPADERRLHLLSRRFASSGFAYASSALIGGEARETSGDPRLDSALAQAFGGTRVAVPGTGLTLLIHGSPPDAGPAGANPGTGVGGHPPPGASSVRNGAHHRDGSPPFR